MRRKSLGDLIGDGLLGVRRYGGEHRRDWAGGDIEAGELKFLHAPTSTTEGFASAARTNEIGGQERDQSRQGTGERTEGQRHAVLGARDRPNGWPTPSVTRHYWQL
jgi:hypothetical protein